MSVIKSWYLVKITVKKFKFWIIHNCELCWKQINPSKGISKNKWLLFLLGIGGFKQRLEMRRSPKIKSLCCQNIYSEKFFLLFLQFLITFNKQIYFISPMVDWISEQSFHWDGVDVGLGFKSRCDPVSMIERWSGISLAIVSRE